MFSLLRTTLPKQSKKSLSILLLANKNLPPAAHSTYIRSYSTSSSERTQNINFPQWTSIIKSSLALIAVKFAFDSINDSNDTKAHASSASEVNSLAENDQNIEIPCGAKTWNNYKIKIYMYHGCPFCAKVEAYLKFHNIPYERVEVNALTKQPLKKDIAKKYNYKKVPAVMFYDVKSGDEFLIKDSCRVISVLESLRVSQDYSVEKLEFLLDTCYGQYERELPGKPGEKAKFEIAFSNVRNVMYLDSSPETGEPIRYTQDKQMNSSIVDRPSKDQIRQQVKWRDWIEDHFLHSIAPNLYISYSDSIANTQHYINISPTFSKGFGGKSIVYTGGPVMKIIGGIVAKRYGITDPRAHLYEKARHWMANINSKENVASKKYPGLKFISGTEEPMIADLEMFGLCSILEGTRVYPDLMENVPELEKWYLAMRQIISDKCGQPQDAKFFIEEFGNNVYQANCVKE